MMKNEQIQIRVSKREKNLIRKRADAAQMDMSAWILSQLFTPMAASFHGLCETLAKSAPNEQSYAFAAIHDFLAKLSAEQISNAIQDAPGATLNEFQLNYLAAMVERSCNLKSTKVPKWIMDATGLRQPHFGSNLNSLRLHLLTQSPPPFRKRNIFIDSSVGDRL